MTTTIELAAEAIKTLTTAQLIALHNEASGKETKRFATRGAGEKATIKALDANPKVLNKFLSGGKSKKAKAVKEPKAPREKKVREPKEPADRSAAIAKSWENPQTKAKRSKRDHVVVAGQEYRSVKAAFEALKLPLEKHIAFRMTVKHNGEAVFEAGGKKIKFAIAK